jgi:GNAT superfamily N-acetyltransferase
MNIREAQVSDIPRLQVIRHSVKENTLSDPSLVTDEDCMEYLTKRGKGWVAELDGSLIGFAIADLQDHNIWALFIHPSFENKGVGKALHAVMMDWYFKQTETAVWLSTGIDTRAENFYRLQGWTDVGMYNDKERRFEMTLDQWKSRNRQTI